MDLRGQGHPHPNDLAGIETCATSGQAVARRGQWHLPREGIHIPVFIDLCLDQVNAYVS